ncbi:GlxA family transcriptional regulator [Zoogloea sp.]|uniref:GlxA family transcriptional regulator n=1 Tax=Zoogloea sp. TaxID=49181 RepID=UPI0035B10F05
MSRRVVVLAFDGISAFHLSVPYAVFGEDRTEIGIPRYEVSVCAVEAGPIRTSMGFQMDVRDGMDGLARAEWLIVPSWGNVLQPAPPRILEALRAAHQRGTKVVGLCLGAFVLADAGLLDGRTATTHWAWADTFAKRFPAVTLDAQVLYIDHGDVVTSAGTAAAMDCCLHLLRQDLGADSAGKVARRLVIPPYRQGNQAQYVEQLSAAGTTVNRIAKTLEWAQRRLDSDLDIDTLARQAIMSRRTFTRHFQKATGMSFVPWLTAQRVFQAQKLLETTDFPIEEVASKAGFGNPLSLRLAFSKCLNTTPSHYRREFGNRTASER